MTIEQLIERLSALNPNTRVYKPRDYTGDLDQITGLSIRVNDHGEVVAVLD